MSRSDLQPRGGARSVADSARAETRAGQLSDLRLTAGADPVAAVGAGLDLR